MSRTLASRTVRRLRKLLIGSKLRIPVGSVDFGNLRSVAPLGSNWGYDRGKPIDRYYIESFLADHAADVRGRVLEVHDDEYTVRFGVGRVTRSDVLDLSHENRRATIVADLTAADHVPDGQFDCIICTQTLQLIYDLPAAIATLHRWLSPGGVLLATLPGICQISRADMHKAGDYWRVTTASAQRLFANRFGEPSAEVTSFGNVLTAVAFLEGIVCEELSPDELDAHDPDYQVTVAVRAVKIS